MRKNRGAIWNQIINDVYATSVRMIIRVPADDVSKNKGVLIMELQMMAINDLIPYVNNPRQNDDAVDAVASSIKNFGFKVPIVIDGQNEIINGHTRLKAAKKLGLTEVPVIKADDLSPEQVKAFRLADNKVSELAEWDEDLLAIELEELENLDFDMSEFGFEELDDFQTTKDKIENNDYSQPLSESFITVPLSFLDTRKGEWQERKRQWKDVGIASEVGRDEQLVFAASMNTGNLTGTSIFDPVLCEVSYHWFMPDKNKGTKILDCFAGGSVRGVVANMMGYDYTGIDLRQEQIDANYLNAKEIGLEGINWICDDSLNIGNHVQDETMDLLFTCPPYADLEVYSDNPSDISNMDYEEFSEIYRQIITKAVGKLKNNRFAIVVISDVRDKDGFYRDLQSLTKQAMAAGGAYFYNDIVLLNAMGSGGMRVRRNMRNRKVVRSHQNVLVFFKGNQKDIKGDFSELTSVKDILNDEMKELEQ